MRQLWAPEDGDQLKPPEPLEFISGYSAPRRATRRYKFSMVSSVVVHLLAFYGLLLNPHILISFRGLLPGEAEESGGEGDYRMITYVPSSNQTMYIPYRKPEGELYSAQDTLAISRPPRGRAEGNLMPYSRGTTSEPLITDLVKKMEPRKPEEARPGAETAEKAEEVAQAAPRAGSVPDLNLPPTEQMPSASALVAPRPTPPRPEIGNPNAVPREETREGNPARAERDEQTRIRVAEDVARQLKLADVGQRIFENEASALRSEGAGFFDTRGFELSSYSQFVVDRIKQNWLIPSQARSDSGRSTIIFYIEKDGQISRLRLVTPSGRRDLDVAAMNSILGSSPFPPLPRDFTGEHIGAKLIFSYNEVRTP